MLLYVVTTTDEPNNVLLGHVTFAEKAGFTPVFVFPARPGVSVDLSCYNGAEMIRLPFLFQAHSAWQYALSIFRFAIWTTWVLLKRKEVSHVLCVDLPGALACLVLRLRSANVVVLVNDNFSARYNLNNGLFRLLRLFENIIYKLCADVCVFPDKCRYDLLGAPRFKRVVFLPNVLDDEGAPEWVGSRSEKLVVLMCGWLVPTRGLELIPDLLAATIDSVEFLLVGSGDARQLGDLASRSRVRLKHSVPRSEMLEILSVADVNLALYNPLIRINRVALPQKVSDSLLVLCPLIINKEVQISETLTANGVCLSCGYFEIRELAEMLNGLARNKEALRSLSSEMRVFRPKTPSYGQVERLGVQTYKEFIRNET